MINLKKKPYPPPSNEAGFTLIESLVAIIVVTIMMIAISPAIVLSVATRLQTKRLELGTDAAKTYISGVRAGTIPAPPISNNTPTAIAAPSGTSLSCTQLTQADGTTPIPRAYSCTSSVTDAALYCIDNDDTPNGCSVDSIKDMVVQGFGMSKDPNLPADQEQAAAKGYQLGIRVYRADAFQDSGDLQKSDATNGKVEAKTVAAGLGGKKAPLVETTTEVASDTSSYSDLCDRLTDPSNTNSLCN